MKQLNLLSPRWTTLVLSPTNELTSDSPKVNTWGDFPKQNIDHINKVSINSGQVQPPKQK